MQSYRLRHRIEFQTPTATQNSTTGEMINSYATLAVDGVDYDAVPAEVLTGAGRNQVTSGAEQHSYDCRINLRWFDISLPDLLQCRIIWDSRIYEIVSAEQDITARREWRLFCKGGIEVYQNAESIANYPFTSNLLDLVNGYSLGYAVEPTPSADGISITGTNDAKIPTTGWLTNNFQIKFDLFLNVLHNGKQILDFYVSPTQQWLLLGFGNNAFSFVKRDGSFTTATGFVTGSVHNKWLSVTMTQTQTDGVTIHIVGDSYETTATANNALGKSDITLPTFLSLAGTGADYKIKNFTISTAT